MKEGDKVLEILKKVLQELQKENVIELKSLSDEAIKLASVNQDSESIVIAIIIYSLSKIIERGQQKDLKSLLAKAKKSLNNSIRALEKNNEEKFKINLRALNEVIENVSGKNKSYIQDVFKKASINKASKIYETGISMEKTAKILNVSLWDLANYAGQKNLNGNEEKSVSAKERVKLAMEIFE